MYFPKSQKLPYMQRLSLGQPTKTVKLGGVTQQSELRPASFRGALRYWYRALAGAATRGRKVDCLANSDQTCCSINSILRGCAGRQRPVQSPRTKYPQSLD